MRSLAQTTSQRSNTSSYATKETVSGVVKQVYSDANGNVYAADVLVNGRTTIQTGLSNSSGINLWVNASVLLANERGNPLRPTIISLSGSQAGTTLAQNQAGYVSSIYGASTQSDDLSVASVWLESGDDAFPNAFVINPGSNVYFATTPSQDTSGGLLNSTLTINAVPLVLTSLPNINSVLNSTLVDLIDSYRNSLGMYRADLVSGRWVRRDVGGSVLSPSGVIPGNYTNATITVNASGLITSASSGSGGSGSPAGNAGDIQLKLNSTTFTAAANSGFWFDTTNNRLALLWKTTPTPIYSLEINNASTNAALGVANMAMYCGAASSGTTSGPRFVMGFSGIQRANNFEIAVNAAINDNFPGTTGGDVSICHSGTLWFFDGSWTTTGTGLWAATPTKTGSIASGNFWQSGTLSIGTSAAQTTRAIEVDSASSSAPQFYFHQTNGNAVSLLIDSSNGVFQAFISGGAGNFIPGTATGDSGITVSTSKKFYIGDGSTARLSLDSSGNAVLAGTVQPGVAGGYKDHTGASGLTVVITTAALTSLGSQGSQTFVDGILTAEVQAT